MDFNNLAPKIMEEYNINPDLYEFEYKFFRITRFKLDRASISAFFR